LASSKQAGIYNLDLPELEDLLNSWGQPAYRAEQIWQGLYQKFYSEPDQFTSLPKTLRQRLADQFARSTPDGRFTFSELTPSKVLDSEDMATRKALFSLGDQRLIEAVLMRYDKRRTLCISSQSGCAMGCVFCATGQMGFLRNLSIGEIVEQVLFYARQLASEGVSVTNVVVMGMGEPFHNYDATLAAIDRLNHVSAMNLGVRRFTISTVGLVPAIRRFTSERRQINLAVSLHAAEDELRTKMLPVNKRYPLDELMAACLEYVQQTHRRISFEWALIEGVNDTSEQARKLAQLLQKLRVNESLLCHINAIPLNPTRSYKGKATSLARAQAFINELRNYGIPCTIRLRRGIDIQAGCGQLAGQTEI
jgi:23S rRNA (adenine2503-C2)-methyltransferase